MPNGKPFQQKPDTGAMFTQQRDRESQPAMKGTVTLSVELVGHLVRALQEGRPAVIEVAGWPNQKTNGETYWSLKVSPPYERPAYANATAGKQMVAPSPRQAYQGANGPGPRRPPAATPGQRSPAFEGVPPWLKRDQQQMKDWVAPKDDDDGVPY